MQDSVLLEANSADEKYDRDSLWGHIKSPKKSGKIKKFNSVAQEKDSVVKRAKAPAQVYTSNSDVGQT